MTRFLDRIIASARREGGASPRPVVPAAIPPLESPETGSVEPVLGGVATVPGELAAAAAFASPREPGAPAGPETSSIQWAPSSSAAPSPSSATTSAPLAQSLAVDTAVSTEVRRASAPSQPPPRGERRPLIDAWIEPAEPRPISTQSDGATPERSSPISATTRAFTGAWMETHDPREAALAGIVARLSVPRDAGEATTTAAPTLVAAASAAEPTSAIGARHALGSGAGPTAEVSSAAAAPPVSVAPSPVEAPPDLHIDQLDIHIVTEPAVAPRATVPSQRQPSHGGAWQPSARRFLGRP